VSLPEEIGAVGANEPVEGIVRLSTRERWVLSHHNEQDYSTCEKIHRCTNIGSASMDFGCHVALSAELGLASARTILSSDRRCEAEVSNLKVELVVEQHVLGLQVSVSDASLMDVVEAVKKLPEVEAGGLLIETAS